LEASTFSFFEQPFDAPPALHFWFDHPDEELRFFAAGQIGTALDTHHARSSSVSGFVKVPVAGEERT
jgi:hypothetical protein